MAVDRVGVTGTKGGGPKPLGKMIRAAWMAAAVCSVPQIFIFSMTTVGNEDSDRVDCWAQFGGIKALEKVVALLPFDTRDVYSLSARSPLSTI